MLSEFTEKSIHYNSGEVSKFLVRALYQETDLKIPEILDPKSPKNVEFTLRWKNHLSPEVSAIISEDLVNLNVYINSLQNENDEGDEEESEESEETKGFEWSEETLEFCRKVKTPWLNFYSRMQSSFPIYDFGFKYYLKLTHFLKGKQFPKHGDHPNGGDNYEYDNLPSSLEVNLGNSIQVWNGNMIKILGMIHSENFDETLQAKVSQILKFSQCLNLKTMSVQFCDFLNDFRYLAVDFLSNNVSFFESQFAINVYDFSGIQNNPISKTTFRNCRSSFAEYGNRGLST
jgi:hypothetical protein